MERIHIETVVIGAGVVGLSCARRLAMAGQDVLVFESADRCGEGVSARNSGVIHAGLYYPAGSRKAVHCVRGKHLLYDYLSARRLPHHNSGKLIVAATASDLPQLEAIMSKGRAAGVDDLSLVDRAWLAKNEPGIDGDAALVSPSSGWLDSADFVHALEADIDSAGGQIITRATVDAIHTLERGFELECRRHDTVIACQRLVLAAGIETDALLASAPNSLRQHIPRQIWARGIYFILQGKSPFTRHIYPLPVKGGLGIHATVDGEGGVKFGPDVEWLDRQESNAALFRVDEERKPRFLEAIAQYWPSVKQAQLLPGYAGIRPKLEGSKDGFRDFGIFGPEAHGLENLVCLTGIESPGLTAALSIAEEVFETLKT